MRSFAQNHANGDICLLHRRLKVGILMVSISRPMKTPACQGRRQKAKGRNAD